MSVKDEELTAISPPQSMFQEDAPSKLPGEMILERKKRVLLHAGTGPVRGSAFVGMTHFKKILDRFPDLPANIPHMGGLEFESFLGLLDRHPGLYLDTSYSFVPHTPCKFDLGNDCLEKYRDRILYGSDFPNLIHPREDEMECLLQRGLSSEFYTKVFHDNGRRLLGRPAAGIESSS